jgi:hypothetical protein
MIEDKSIQVFIWDRINCKQIALYNKVSIDLDFITEENTNKKFSDSRYKIIARFF